MAAVTALRPLRRGVGIPRVSKRNGREGEGFRSPDNQWSDIGHVCTRKGIELLNTRGADIDVSGTTMQRKALRAGIDAIGRGEADCLVFAKLDRYARTVLGGLAVLEEVEALGGSLYFGDLDIDTSTNIGRQIFVIMLSNAEREVADKRDELARNARDATLAGIAIAPLLAGYRKRGDDEERPRRVDVDGSRSELIRPLFERRAANESWSAIRRWWHEETGDWLKLSAFRRMVESRLYLGELRYGGVESPVGHPALVDPQLWKDAQTMKPTRPRRSEGSTALLAGVLVCSGCDRPMTLSRGGATASPLYRCQSRANVSWKCERPVSLMAAPADAYVVEHFLAWADGRATVETSGDRADDFAALDARIADAEEELAAYLEKTPARSARFADGAVKREDAVEALVAERAALEAVSVVAGVRYTVATEWPTLTVDERRRLLRAGIKRVVVHPALSRRPPIGSRVPLIVFADGATVAYDVDGAGA